MAHLHCDSIPRVYRLPKLWLKKSISVVTSSCLVRVTSWIVPFVRETKDDPRSHTNQHEPKHSYVELDPTFEAKLFVNKYLSLFQKSSSASATMMPAGPRM